MDSATGNTALKVYRLEDLTTKDAKVTKVFKVNAFPSLAAALPVNYLTAWRKLDEYPAYKG